MSHRWKDNHLCASCGAKRRWRMLFSRPTRVREYSFDGGTTWTQKSARCLGSKAATSPQQRQKRVLTSAEEIARAYRASWASSTANRESVIAHIIAEARKIVAEA